MSTLITVTGPTCSGKSTLEKMLREQFKLQNIISFTTRAPREGEKDGVHYYFISREEAEKQIDEGRMAEHVEFNNNLYGILGDQLELKLSTGHVVAVVEPNGVKQLSLYCKTYNLKHRAVFITNPYNTLMARFLKRFKEDFRASPIDYAARAVAMIKSEQDWIFGHEYDMIFTSFDSSNELTVVQQVYSEATLA